MNKFYYFITIVLSAMLFTACSDSSNSTDDTKTLTISRAPISAGTPVSTLHMLSLEFSTEIDPDSINSSTVYIMESLTLTKVDSELNVDINNTKVTIKPYTYLKPSTTYNFIVTTAVKSAEGQSLTIPYTYVFTTLNDSTDPGTQMTLVKTNPANAAIAAANTNITLEFDRYVAPSDTAPFSVVDLNTSQTISGSLNYFNSSIIFKPDTDFTADHTIDVVINNSALPTDMYANTSSLSGFKFDIESSAIGSSTWADNAALQFSTGKKSSKIRYIGNDSAIDDYIAVARDGGVDIYTYGIEAPDLEKWNKQAVYTLDISSEITDIVFADETNNQFLLVATAEDGFYVVDLTDKANITSNQYMQNVGFIYGIGYSAEALGNGVIDRIYAVGPTIGMYVYSVSSGVLTLLNTVAIDGTPLKVVSSGSFEYVLVTDYTNGVRVYDENGTDPSLLSMTTPPKHILDFLNLSSSNNEIAVSDSLGYLYHTSTDTGSSPTSSVQALNSYLTIPSRVEDIQEFSLSGDTVVAVIHEKGLYTLDTYMLSEFEIQKTNLISTTQLSTGDIITLTKDGVIDVYQQF